MKRLHRLLPVAAALSGCAAPPPAVTAPAVAVVTTPQPLTAAAVQALYASPHREDGTVLHGSHQGANWTKWAKPDGSMELLAGHGLFADTGRYVLRGNTVCTAWAHVDGGRETCMHLVQVSADEYVTYDPAGIEGSRFKIGPP